MNIETFLSEHPYSETTKRTYRDILQRLLVQTQPESVSASSLLEFVKSQGWGNARQCVALAACQKFLRWQFGNSHPALLAKLKRQTGKPQRALDEPTALKLLASFDRFTPKGARDLALCSLALDTGLRASELCRLLMSDTDLDRGVLQVVIKGGQWAAAVFSPETAAHLAHWYRYRPTVSGPGYVFLNIQQHSGLTKEGLWKIVHAWGAGIGIDLSPHDLRRSFAVLATENGAPERVLMAGGRWSNSTMITRYTRTLRLETMRQYLPVKNLRS